MKKFLFLVFFLIVSSAFAGNTPKTDTLPPNLLWQVNLRDLDSNFDTGADIGASSLLSPDGTYCILSGSKKQALTKFNLQTRQIIKEFHDGSVGVKFSKDGKTLLALTGYSARLYSMPEFVFIKEIPLINSTHTGKVINLGFSPDTNNIFVLRDWTFEEWSMKDSSYVRLITDLTNIHGFSAHDISNDGKYVGVGSTDLSAIIDVQTGKIVKMMGAVGGMHFSPDGKQLAATFKNSKGFNELGVIEMGTWKSQYFSIVEPTHDWWESPSFSQGGRYIVTQGGGTCTDGGYGLASFWIFDTEIGRVFPIKGLKYISTDCAYLECQFPFFSLDSSIVYSGLGATFWAYDVTNEVTGINQQNNNSNTQIMFSITPNPITSNIFEIQFRTNTSAPVSISLVDILGRTTAVVQSQYFSSGENSVSFDIGSLANGIYVCQMQINGQIYSQKLTISR